MNRDIIVIGASAGGVEVLMEIVGALPTKFAAAVFLVLHLPSESRSALALILGRAGKLPVTTAVDGEKFKNGHIYVAPPDYHLLIQADYIHLDHGATENRHRPAIDPLFRTAAESYGNRVIGVVLCGMLDDGTAGLAIIKSCGGTAIVQDPASTLYKGMPQSASEHVEVDYLLPPSQIAPTLVSLVSEPLLEADDVKMPEESETSIMETIPSENTLPALPSEFACPTCGGVLWENSDGKHVHFRCRTGHAFSPQSLLAEQGDGLEAALWAALRALEERKSLVQRLADRAMERGHSLAAEQFQQQFNEAEHDVSLIKNILGQGWPHFIPDGD
jgi:two-component system, chemotaxis family, protein-glutamate methylesterase/glutaminase